MTEIKILLIADTHLGIDIPVKPRVKKRRRGEDFYNNMIKALEWGKNNNVDMIVHGGDVFYRNKIHPRIVSDSFKPLLDAARKGIPVLIVPGNHERAFLPLSLFDLHENIMIFDKPRTYNISLKGINYVFAGFPYHYDGIRDNLSRVIKQTGHGSVKGDFNFLCMHHIVEGAVVGVQNYVFRYGRDIIKGSSLPAGFDAVLSGHIHRAQILESDLQSKPLPAPVIYPGAIERTSFAEREETKGFYLLTAGIDETGRKFFDAEFIELYARQMEEVILNNRFKNETEIREYLEEKIRGFSPDAIVRLKVKEGSLLKNFPFLTNKYLRSISPEEMDISISCRRQ